MRDACDLARGIEREKREGREGEGQLLFLTKTEEGKKERKKEASFNVGSYYLLSYHQVIHYIHVHDDTT
jgi:hypothetical protein